MNATITRCRVARSRLATGPGAAWKYVYTVTRPDGTAIVTDTDRLSIAERAARRDGLVPVRAWVAPVAGCPDHPEGLGVVGCAGCEGRR